MSCLGALISRSVDFDHPEFVVVHIVKRLVRLNF